MAVIGFMQLFSSSFWRQILTEIVASSKRFPLALLCLSLLTLLSLGEIHHFTPFDNSQTEKLVLLFVGGFLWFSSSTLLAENQQWSNLKKYVFMVGVFSLYIVYIYFNPKVTLSTMLLLASVLLTLSFFPRIFRRNDNASDWFYNYQIIAAIIMATLTGLILSGGLSLSLLSIGYLFEFKIPDKLYADIWLLGMMVFTPFYVLTQLPNEFDFEEQQCGFPKGVYFILNFVMVPLALIYMIILYAYFGKILIQWDLPRGHLGWMISVFGVIGILTHLAIYPLSDKNKPMLGWFYRNFYKVMFVPLLLLAMAIGTRIHQYGVTENRYLVVICLIWFCFLILINIFKNHRFKLTTVTLSLSILCFSSAFGPWGIQQLPINSQFSQFKKILSQNGLLKNGKISHTKKELDLKVRKSLSSIAWFLAKKDSLGKFRVLFENPEAFDAKFKCEKPETYCRSRDTKGLFELINIKYVEHWRSYRNTHTTITLTVPSSNKTQLMIPVNNYDYYLPIRWMKPNNEYMLFSIEKGESEASLSLSFSENNELQIKSTDSVILSFDIIQWAEKFPKHENQNIPLSDLEKVKLYTNGNGYSGLLYITRASIDNTTSKNRISNISGHLLIKKLQTQ